MSDVMKMQLARMGVLFRDSVSGAPETADGTDLSVPTINPTTGEMSGLPKALAAAWAPRLQKKEKITVAIFGDSWTNSNLTNSASRVDYNTLGYYTYLKSIAGGRLSIIGEYGYAGATSVQLLAHLPDAVSADADIYIYQAGTNDAYWNNHDGSITLAQSYAADQTIISALAAAGKLCLVMGAPPRNDAVSPDTPAMQQYIAQLSIQKRALCSAISGAIYVEIFSVLADPATGAFATGLDNGDGVHLSPTGSCVVNRALYAALGGSSLIGATVPLSTSPFDTDNIWYNPALQGANASGANGFVISAGATGTGPDGHRIQRSGGSIAAVLSQVARASDDLSRGLALNFAVTGDGTGANAVQLQYRALSAAWVNSASVPKGAAVRPTTPNGYRYVMVSSNGTVGSAEPTWPTTLGAKVTDNAGKVWMCVKDFQPGELWQLSIDVLPSSFNGNFDTNLTLQAVNESSTILFTSGDMTTVTDVSTYPTFGSAYQPALRLQTLPMVIPSGTTRLYMTVGVRAPTGVTGNLQIVSCRCEKVSASVVQAS